ncbi:MAG: hypothetical protein J6A15_03460 [Clostridia bacterium]|nr:hypothetical protein [Clostridia bacterium]
MKFKCIFLAIIICSLFCINNVYAVKSGEIPLELKIINDSNQTSTDRFVFELVPLDENNPMPSSSKDGKAQLTISKSGIYSFGTVEYFVPGDYEYQVYQIPGSNNQYKYDNSVYKLIVTVVNSKDMSHLETHITITKDNMEEKYENLYFENEYFPPLMELPDTSDTNVLFYVVTLIASLFILTRYIRIGKRKDN